jgi:hypothetical protein
MTDDDRIMTNPEALTEIAIRAFARAKDAAIRENDRLGIPSYGSKDGQIVVRQPERGTTSLKDGEAHPAAQGALQFLNALSFEERQDFLLTFSSLAIEGNRLAEVCFGTLRRLIDGAPVSDRYLLGLAWEIKSIVERRC